MITEDHCHEVAETMIVCLNIRRMKTDLTSFAVLNIPSSLRALQVAPGGTASGWVCVTSDANANVSDEVGYGCC